MAEIWVVMVQEMRALVAHVLSHTGQRQKCKRVSGEAREGKLQRHLRRVLFFARLLG